MYNVVNVENVIMCMLGELFCNVVNIKVIYIFFGDVLLVECFDIYKGKLYSYFLSVNLIFSMNKVSNVSMCIEYIYGYLVEFIMKYVFEFVDVYDLYYWMVFNVLMGNMDDYFCNYVMFYNFIYGYWWLSLVYDVLFINYLR